MIENTGLKFLLTTRKYVLGNIDQSHIETRTTKYWGTKGYENDPPRKILIKDISDTHLKNIITYIIKYNNHYSDSIKQLMENELTFRQLNNISVPEYKKNK